MARQKKPHDPFRWFASSPDVIRLVEMMYVLASEAIRANGQSIALLQHAGRALQKLRLQLVIWFR